MRSAAAACHEHKSGCQAKCCTRAATRKPSRLRGVKPPRGAARQASVASTQRQQQQGAHRGGKPCRSAAGNERVIDVVRSSAASTALHASARKARAEMRACFRLSAPRRLAPGRSAKRRLCTMLTNRIAASHNIGSERCPPREALQPTHGRSPQLAKKVARRRRAARGGRRRAARRAAPGDAAHRALKTTSSRRGS